MRMIFPDNLTVAEFKVLAQVLKDLRDKEVAAKLNISRDTVKFHKKNIYKKYKVNTLLGLFKKVYSLK